MSSEYEKAMWIESNPELLLKLINSIKKVS